MVVFRVKLPKEPGTGVSRTFPWSTWGEFHRTTVPLCLFLERPQLQMELHVCRLLLTFFYCCQPVPRRVEGGVDDLELLQTVFMDELLLHDVQLRTHTHTDQLVNTQISAPLFNQSMNVPYDVRPPEGTISVHYHCDQKDCDRY